jgi:signal transduction histidine kinase
LNWKIIQVKASFWRIVLPPIFTTLLFVSTIFFLILPFIEESIVARKREMISELVSVAWNNLQFFEQLESTGRLSRHEAQQQAREQIRSLRFGPENSDYFWINDRHPRMIMHPYRPDLEGQDLSQYSDPNGKFLFSEMVTVVENQGAGFVDYMWQWKDDPSRVVPKISYVRGFEPWGWVVGSGIYIEDVKMEIASFTRHLVWVCVGIVGIIMILGSVVVQQGVASRNRWRKAEDEARQHLLRLSHLSRLHTMKTMTTEIAHQIDQPLGSILLRSSLCTDTLEPGDPVTPELIENLEEISVQVERTSRIVKRIRSFSNLRELGKTRVDLNIIISGVLDFLEFETRKNQINLDFFPGKTTLTAAEPIWVLVDSTLVEQVVLNIVQNAIEALGECPSEKRNLTIRTEVEGDTALVVVADNGPGISDDRLESVFEPFTSSKNDGLGIGLSLCRSIVEEHGGRMWAGAGPSQGSIFQFTLPVEC